MLATAILEAAALVLAVGVAVVLVVLVWRRAIGSVKVRGPAGLSIDVEAVQAVQQVVRAELAPVAAQVSSIDRQVNNVGAGEPALRQLVLDQGAAIDDLRASVAAITTRLDDMAAAAARHHPEDTP